MPSGITWLKKLSHSKLGLLSIRRTYQAKLPGLPTCSALLRAFRLPGWLWQEIKATGPVGFQALRWRLMPLFFHASPFCRVPLHHFLTFS